MGEANNFDANGIVTTVSLTVDGEIQVPIILVLVSDWPVQWKKFLTKIYLVAMVLMMEEEIQLGF